MIAKKNMRLGKRKKMIQCKSKKRLKEKHARQVRKLVAKLDNQMDQLTYKQNTEEIKHNLRCKVCEDTPHIVNAFFRKTEKIDDT